jgi:single-strand DNA-binding protein
MYLNKVLLYGNLTRDPELKALPSGTKVVSFSIATNRSYKDKDGKKQESVEFHNLVSFSKQAEVINQYFKKGKPIYVEGRLQTRSWDGADGKKNYRTEIVVDTFQFGPSAPMGGASAGSSSANNSGSAATKDAPAQEDAPMDSIQYPEEDINPDDIPF